MLEKIIELFWLFLPAAVANMTPVLVMKVNMFSSPINTKLFGSHKSYRGFIFGTIAAIIVSFFETYNNIVPYNNYIIIGGGLGFFALLGDLIKSFFKRKIGIAPGKPWIVFDQIDWMVASLIFASFFFYLDIFDWFISILIALIAHPLINYIGYLIKIKKNKF